MQCQARSGSGGIIAVVGVADAADRGLDAGRGQALSVPNRQILPAAITVMDEAVAIGPGMQGLLQRIEGQV